VAEVGNPTIVATLTVVAALLPMLFVSGMMGPYMSPIPANASAAMVFSFFVAVMVTPWLMLKIRQGAGHGTAMPRMRRTAGAGARAYRRVAAPILASKRAPGCSCSRRRRDAGRWRCSTPRRHGEAAALRQQVGAGVVVDLPEGSPSRRPIALQAGGRALADVPEVSRSRPMPARPRRSTSTAWCATPICAPSRRWATWRQSFAKGERKRASHDIALDMRERSRLVACPKGTSVKVVEPPPGPPVMATLLAEIYGPDAETRAQGRRRRCARPSLRALHRRRRRQLRHLARRAEADRSPGQSRIPQGRAERRLRHDPPLYGGTTVGYSHRGGGRQPIPIRLARRRAASRSRRSALSTPVPANALPGDRGVVELGDVVRSPRDRPPSRSSATTAARPRW
jgi:hypothetical protein